MADEDAAARRAARSARLAARRAEAMKDPVAAGSTATGALAVPGAGTESPTTRRRSRSHDTASGRPTSLVTLTAEQERPRAASDAAARMAALRRASALNATGDSSGKSTGQLERRGIGRATRFDALAGAGVGVGDPAGSRRASDAAAPLGAATGGGSDGMDAGGGSDGDAGIEEDPDEALMRRAAPAEAAMPMQDPDEAAEEALRAALDWEAPNDGLVDAGDDVGVDRISGRDQRKHERKVYWHPQPRKPVKLPHLSSGEPFQPRMLEDEGFYVGPTPWVPWWNLNRMEQRLAREPLCMERWFGVNGHMRRLEDPVQRQLKRVDPAVGREATPDALAAEMMPAVVSTNLQLLKQQHHFTLVVELGAVTFTDHPLFSQEDALAAEIVGVFTEYQRRRQANLPVYYTDRLRVLKEALRAIEARTQHNAAAADKDDLLSGAGAGAGASLVTGATDRAHAMRVIWKDIAQTRQQRDADEYLDVVIVRRLIRLWNNIKRVRAEQGYQTTAVRLVVKKDVLTPTEVALEQQRLEQDVEEEVQEAEYQHNAAFTERLREYQEAVRLREERLRLKRARRQAMNERLDAAVAEERERQAADNAVIAPPRGEDEVPEDQAAAAAATGDAAGSSLQARREAALQQRRATQDSRAATDGGDADDEGLDDDGDGVKDAPPVMPVQTRFDAAAVRQRITRRLQHMRPSASEPRLTPILTMGDSATPVASVPAKEAARQKAINRVSVIARLLVNGNEVGTTSKHSMDTSFTVRFVQSFPLQVLKWPDQVEVQLFEAGMLDNKKLLASVFLHVPDSLGGPVAGPSDPITVDTGHMYQFTSPDVVFVPAWDPPRPIHAATGTAVGMTAEHHLAGNVFARASWRSQVPSIPSEVLRRRRDASAADSLASGVVSVARLRRWIADTDLDPNDPRNLAVLSLLQENDAHAAASAGEYFSLSKSAASAMLVPDKAFVPSKRHRLLQLRAERKVTYEQPVPLLDQDIDEDDLIIDAERAETEAGKAAKQGESDFAARVRAAAMKQVMGPRPVRTQDVVREISRPSLGFAMDAFVRLFEPRRPLRPRRKERRVLSTQPLECKLMIQLLRGTNLPVRRVMQDGGGGGGSLVRGGIVTSRRDTSSTINSVDGDGDEADEGVVMSFVEIRFQGQSRRTRVGDGPNTEWNEMLTVPFVPPGNDFSPQNIAMVTDDVYFNVYDEVTINVVQDDRDQHSTHLRHERRWLGGFMIPFATIYQNERVEGSFRLERPIVSPSYHVSAELESSVTLYAAVDPPLAVYEPDDVLADSDEPPDVLRHADRVEKAARRVRGCKDRNYVVVASNLMGKSVFVGRYIRPSAPPASLDTVAKVVRFVSMIPFLEDAASFAGRGNVWNTAQQFLEIAAGDWEEHAVLLCNYFLYMKKEAWVVIGDGIPEGDTAYVMTREGAQAMRFWNASTGLSYAAEDKELPLKRIGTLIGPDNVWLNLQPRDDPASMHYNFADTSAWRGFWHAKQFRYRELRSVQDDPLPYYVTPEAYVQALELNIEQTVQRRFQSWRKRFITRWNRVCGRALRNVLVKCELDRQGVQRLTEDEHNYELAKVLTNYTLNGYPLNLTFTELDPIIEAVYHTNCQFNEDPDVEFALGVYVHAYPNKLGVYLWLDQGPVTMY